MNIKAEVIKIVNVLKNQIPALETNIVKQQASHENIKTIMKELKKVNYRLDRIRSDLKLEKDNFVEKTPREKEKMDVSDSSGINNGCTESNK